MKSLLLVMKHQSGWRVLPWSVLVGITLLLAVVVQLWRQAPGRACTGRIQQFLSCGIGSR
jgi:hypothetical protein